MTDTPAHTPLPWRVCPSFPADIQADGTEIASCFEEKHIGQTWTIEGPITVSYGEHKANAAFIVRACNSHYQLVEALENANTLLTKAFGDIVAYWIMANKRPDPSATAGYVEAINAIDAALSQAGGASD